MSRGGCDVGWVRTAETWVGRWVSNFVWCYSGCRVWGWRKVLIDDSPTNTAAASRPTSGPRNIIIVGFFLITGHCRRISWYTALHTKLQVAQMIRGLEPNAIDINAMHRTIPGNSALWKWSSTNKSINCVWHNALSEREGWVRVVWLQTFRRNYGGSLSRCQFSFDVV